MNAPERFEIRLAPEAERAFLALPISERQHIRSIIDGVAEVTALSPPFFPSWFGRYNLAPPLMRLEASGFRISYELDCQDRSLRICALEPVARAEPRVAPAPRQPSRLSFL